MNVAMNKSDLTIMVVDDEPDDRFFIEQAFRAIGVKNPIQLIECGDEAISYITGEGKFSDRNAYPFPALITTDLKMSRGDGFSILNHLQQHSERAVNPTFVISASPDPDDIKRAYRLGASSYHLKPNSTEDLRQLLKILHEYWMVCEAPPVDINGRRLPTHSQGKLGERFSQEITDSSERVPDRRQ
jgi:CheY-like chemotaxis protein